jgi:hypothetical protein
VQRAVGVLGALTIVVSGIADSCAAGERMPGRHLAPGQVVEMTAEQGAVTATAHYQAEVGLTCSPAYSCRADFPTPGRHHRLHITRISCLLGSNDQNDQYYFGWAFLYSAAGADLLDEALPLDYGVQGEFSVDRPLDMQISATQHLHVQLDLLIGPASGGWCTATGTKDTLG